MTRHCSYDSGHVRKHTLGFRQWRILCKKTGKQRYVMNIYFISYFNLKLSTTQIKSCTLVCFFSNDLEDNKSNQRVFILSSLRWHRGLLADIIYANISFLPPDSEECVDISVRAPFSDKAPRNRNSHFLRTEGSSLLPCLCFTHTSTHTLSCHNNTKSQR